MAQAALSFLLVFAFIVVFAFLAYGMMGGAYRQAPPSDHPPSAGPEGLDPNTVHSLPVLKYAGAKEAGGCVICLGDLDDDRVKVIPGCGHVFHPGCIDGWLLLHGSCPICRCADVVGENVGAFGAGDVRVEMYGGAHEGRAEEGRKLVGPGRSRSFRASAEDSRASLRRTFSA